MSGTTSDLLANQDGSTTRSPLTTPATHRPSSSSISPPLSTASSDPLTGTVSSPPSSSTSTSGCPKGTLAGAIVGSALGAALITLAITFLIFRRRLQRGHNSGTGSRENGTGADRRASKVQPSVVEKTAADSEQGGRRWQAYLPQSADDRTMQDAVKSFFDQIELHVDNYYRKTDTGLDDGTRRAVKQMDTGELPGPIDELMQNPRLALSVIKHSITGLLLAKMTPDIKTTASLLPPHLSEEPTKLHAVSMSANESDGKHKSR